MPAIAQEPITYTSHRDHCRVCEEEFVDGDSLKPWVANGGRWAHEACYNVLIPVERELDEEIKQIEIRARAIFQEMRHRIVNLVEEYVSKIRGDVREKIGMPITQYLSENGEAALKIKYNTSIMLIRDAWQSALTPQVPPT